MIQEPDFHLLPIVYEDPWLRILNKPAGMSVLKDNTGRPSLWDLYPEVFGEPPLVVHRLDKGTSGLLIVARTPRARSNLSRLLSRHKMDKTYLALVNGAPVEEEGVIDLPIEKARKGAFRIAPPGKGLPCLTNYRLLARRGPCSLLQIRPETGRTHQIRVHLTAIGCPLAQDPLYGLVKAKPSESPHLTLHAWKLSFPHPTEDGMVDVESPLPEWSKPHWITPDVPLGTAF